jgi:hypothetical protein
MGRRREKRLWNVLNIGNDTSSRLFKPSVETISSDGGEVGVSRLVEANSAQSVFEIRGENFDFCSFIAQVALVDGFPNLFE